MGVHDPRQHPPPAASAAEEPAAGWKPWGVAVLASAAILAVTLGLMWGIGLFRIPADDPGAKTLAAALALVGAVVSAVVTLVGTVVKFSLDDRNARMAAAEAARSHALAVEAERRNRIEAALRAVDLLSENNQDATRSQIGGAVLALVNLGELELATSLLAQLWPERLVSDPVAELVLLRAFRQDAEEVLETAATVLFENAGLLSRGELYLWPLRTPPWRTDLPLEVRRILVVAAGRWLRADLENDNLVFSSAVGVLFLALDDPHDFVVDVAATALRAASGALDPLTSYSVGEWSVTLPALTERLNSAPAGQYAVSLRLAREIEAAAAGHPPPPAAREAPPAAGGA